MAAVPLPVDDFVLLRGEDVLRSYRASPRKARVFCGECGSPIYSRVDGRDVLRLRAGTLDDATSLVVQAHIHTAGRAPWYTIHDDHPQHPGEEPGRAQSQLTRSAPGNAAP